MRSFLSVVAAFFAALLLTDLVFNFVKKHNKRYIVGEIIESDE